MKVIFSSKGINDELIHFIVNRLYDKEEHGLNQPRCHTIFNLSKYGD